MSLLFKFMTILMSIRYQTENMIHPADHDTINSIHISLIKLISKSYR